MLAKPKPHNVNHGNDRFSMFNKERDIPPNTGGWGYALFNYDAAAGQFTADPATADCGHSCHVAVKSKDHIFHPYQQR